MWANPAQLQGPRTSTKVNLRMSEAGVATGLQHDIPEQDEDDESSQGLSGLSGTYLDDLIVSCCRDLLSKGE